ncbi:hypothetical protein OZX61_02120 [Acinetobacter sp. ESL0695]|uniref:hypothetical protein n=1 Tax=Acinetobacter sp. ESL0695 TaxID=2983215 RepID=UPI0023F077D6|nr:hypothetical protein [Acinetobacter sp. ESL0695]WEV49305.1 hypothetical protein OZX61_02120 [Acinetobacter sp. ESL0695]
MDDKIEYLLCDIPEHADYATEPGELDAEDIPAERITGVKELLSNLNDYIAFQAALLLTNWGINEGFDKLTELIDTDSVEGYIGHRLHSYDATLQYVLDALSCYWAVNSDLGNSDIARKKIFPYVCKIIHRSNNEPFDIRYMFSLVEKYHFNEYIPYLEEHLTAIIDHPEIHRWKIYDAIQSLLKVDHQFTVDLLKSKNKTIEDFDFTPKGLKS